jgi:hypothetical protein
MRRRLVRRLEYLLNGFDVDGQRSDSLIADLKLKRAAETFSIPLSSILIYNLLSTALIEEEGLLDDFMVKRCPDMHAMAIAFKTEGNVRIARLAMTQETWRARFLVAFQLLGRGDAADHDISVGLQILRGTS